MLRNPQFDTYKNPASHARQHDLHTLVIDDQRPERKDSAPQTFELSLNEETQEAIERTPLNPASIRSLRSMYLLLDEWERALRNKNTEKSSEECEILIDTKAALNAL